MTSGIWTRFASASGASSTTSGARSTSTGTCRISWSRTGSIPEPPCGSSRKLLRSLQYASRVIVTDKLKSYAAAGRTIPPHIEHRQSNYLNNDIKVSHQTTRLRERQIRRFRLARHAQRLRSTNAHVDNYVQLRHHHLTASQHRAARNVTFEVWQNVTGAATVY